MKIICLNDKYKPQDRVSRGKVKCFDQSGNKVFDNSNMIVSTGRSAIRKVCLDNILTNCKIYIGNTGTTPTSYDYNKDFDKTKYEEIAKKVIGADSVNPDFVIGAGPVFSTTIDGNLVKDGQDTGLKDTTDNRTALADPDNPDFVRTVINIPTRQDHKEISDLCIVQSDGNLFSRVCFDKLLLDNNNSYTLIYFIYF